MRGSASRFVLLLAALSLAVPVPAQVNIDAYRDYFLVGRFGEVCTMCEVVVLCEEGDAKPSDDAVPAAGDFTLYHLQTRTFWSQVSTIREWFIANFSEEDLAARGHTRPVHVYEVAAGKWSARKVVEARLVLNPPVIELGAHNIDRVSRAWQRAAWVITVGEIYSAVGLLVGVTTRIAACVSMFILCGFAIGGYYDASLIPFFIVNGVFLFWASGLWLGVDRPLARRNPGSRWFR